MARIGVDLGGSKIAAIVLEDDGTVSAEQRRQTPRHDYDATLEAIALLVAELEAGRGSPLPVGIGHPGAISPASGRLKNANSTWLNDRPLVEDLQLRLRRRVRLANDADCFALSEAADGAAAGASPVFGVILGTGVGGGIVVDGRRLTGPNAIGGEWGHNALPWPGVDEIPGPDCWCGRQGCIESWLSGPGLSADHRRLTGEALTAEAIVARALGRPAPGAAGDAGGPTPGAAEAAAATLERYQGRLARGLAMVINLIDPEVIVLGGGLSNIARLYETVPQIWGRWVFSDRVDTRLRPPAHGDASGVRGAARLWPLR